MLRGKGRGRDVKEEREEGCQDGQRRMRRGENEAGRRDRDGGGGVKMWRLIGEKRKERRSKGKG